MPGRESDWASMHFGGEDLSLTFQTSRHPTEQACGFIQVAHNPLSAPELLVRSVDMEVHSVEMTSKPPQLDPNLEATALHRQPGWNGRVVLNDLANEICSEFLDGGDGSILPAEFLCVAKGVKTTVVDYFARTRRTMFFELEFPDKTIEVGPPSHPQHFQSHSESKERDSCDGKLQTRHSGRRSACRE